MTELQHTALRRARVDRLFCISRIGIGASPRRTAAGPAWPTASVA